MKPRWNHPGASHSLHRTAACTSVGQDFGSEQKALLEIGCWRCQKLVWLEQASYFLRSSLPSPTVKWGDSIRGHERPLVWLNSPDPGDVLRHSGWLSRTQGLSQMKLLMMRRKTGSALFCPRQLHDVHPIPASLSPGFFLCKTQMTTSLLLLPQLASFASVERQGPTGIPIAVDYLKKRGESRGNRDTWFRTRWEERMENIKVNKKQAANLLFQANDWSPALIQLGNNFQTFQLPCMTNMGRIEHLFFILYWSSTSYLSLTSLLTNMKNLH